MNCGHPEHRPPMGKISSLVLVDTQIEGDKIVFVYEYTCPGCKMKTRSSHVSYQAPERTA